MPTDSCASCGGALPAGSRFCPECGARVEDGDSTAVAETPPHETGPGPVQVARAEPRFYGVTPPVALSALAAAGLVLGIVLLIAGHTLPGALLLALAVVLTVLLFRGSGRRPETLGVVRARAGVAVESLSARSAGRREFLRLRREVIEAAAARDDRVRRLGEAVYRGDEQGAGESREQVRELEESIAAKEAEMAAIAADAEKRIKQAHFQVQETQMLEPPQQPGTQEPYPPPEIVPPQLPDTPEPYPPPDEGDPPQPPQIPEPTPGGPSTER